MFLTLLAVPALYSMVAAKARSPQYASRLLDRLMGAPSQPTH